MEKFVVETSPALNGEVMISGAKNSVLKLMAATLLAEGKCVISDVPDLLDVEVMIELLEELGSKVEYNKEKKQITTEVIDDSLFNVSYDITNRMRASISSLGPLIGRRLKAKVALPGGCPIGSRPIDLHIKGLKALGVEVKIEHGFAEGESEKRLKGGNIYLDFPSVGATENIIMAAVLAEGTTTIENAAQEPEIVDLVSFLIKMGASISGAGTSTIKIKGVEKLRGVSHQVMPDRIEAGTYMIAFAITRGKGIIRNVVTKHIRPIISKLIETGVIIEENDDYISIDATNANKAVDLTTLPYPGFPTDVQAQFMALLSVADGISVVKETIFENRFMHVNEMMRMGANIKIDGSSALIKGVDELEGASVKATDLRAGAALILSGFVASGETEVYNIRHIDRGFVNIEEKLSKIGAKIKRVRV